MVTVSALVAVVASVALDAFPVRSPSNVVAVSVFVLGLYVRPLSDCTSASPVDVLRKGTLYDAFVEFATTATAFATLAVSAFPDRLPTSVPPPLTVTLFPPVTVIPPDGAIATFVVHVAILSIYIL